MNIAVLHRYPVCEIKGTNPSFAYFLDELRNRGHAVHVITGLYFNRASSLDKWLKSILFILFAPLKVIFLKIRHSLDVIYCDDSIPFYAYLVKIISGLPTIMRLGDLQTAYLFYDKNKICYSVLHCAEKLTWRKIDKIIAISESFKRFLRSEGIDETKISVVEESIDVDEFYREVDPGLIRKQYAIADSPLVLFHGLVAKIKGLDILLKAVPDTLKTYPRLKVMIVGGGPELNSLKGLARRLSISDSVIFTGWVPLSEIPYYIAACDIGIPIRSDNLGNNFVVTTAFLQYSLFKKPVVVPELDSFLDLTKHNKFQRVFSFKDPALLAGHITYLLRNKDEARMLGEINYNIVRERFAAEKIAKDLATACEAC